jgi:hypothetical protein
MKFYIVLSEPRNHISPLRRFSKDLQENQLSFNLTLKGGVFGNIVLRGLIRYTMESKATLNVNNQMVFDAIRNGLGFSKVIDSTILSVTLKEQEIVECVRKMVSVSDLALRICNDLASYPNSRMDVFILQYLVCYALVTGIYPTTAKVRACGGLLTYLCSDNNGDEVCFPDHCCGPDIVYQYNGVVYIIQIDVDEISKQERVNACHTTDPKYFYWNNNSHSVLAGFEEARDEILKFMEGFTIKRLLFQLDASTTDAGMEGVEIINRKTMRTFFHKLDPCLCDNVVDLGRSK